MSLPSRVVNHFDDAIHALFYCNCCFLVPEGMCTTIADIGLYPASEHSDISVSCHYVGNFKKKIA